MYGKRIAETRARRGMTQRALAVAAHIATGTMSSYESSRKMPPADVMLRMAKVLGVSVEWLLEGDVSPFKVDRYAIDKRTGRRVRLIDCISGERCSWWVCRDTESEEIFLQQTVMLMPDED